MKRIVVWLAGLSLFLSVQAEEATRDAKALEILQQVDSTIKAVTAVRYHSKTMPSGVAAQRSQPAEGETYLEGWNNGMVHRFYAHVKTKDPQTGDDIEVTGGGDGDTYFVIDHRTKKGYEDMDPGVLGRTGRAVDAIRMNEFIHDRPYDDELNANEIELLEDEEVAGEPCYQIRVAYGGGNGESIWFFSRNDYLPRRRIRVFDSPQGEGRIDLVVMNLEVQPKIDSKLFKMKLPEGYEAIDDFAP